MTNRTWKIHGYTFPCYWLDRFYREEVLGLTQQEAAYCIDVQCPNLSNFERGIKWSGRIHNGYVDMGVTDWSYTITPDAARLLHMCYSGEWKELLNARSPGNIPMRRKETCNA